MASAAADQVSYDDLYKRWERANWRATEIDFGEDRRQDEIGTPFAVTIDHQTSEDGTVTLRDRDTLAQERVPVDGLLRLLQDRLTVG